MSDTVQRVFVWITAAFSVLLQSAAVFLHVSGRNHWPAGFNDWMGNVIFSLTLLGPTALGVIILSRQPRNRYGWLWLAFGLNWSVAVFAEGYVAQAFFVNPGRLPFGTAVALTSLFTWTLGVGMLPLVMLLFPNGQIRSWPARLVARLSLFCGILATLLAPFANGDLPMFPVPNPLALSGATGRFLADVVNALVTTIFLLMMLAALVLVARLFRSQGEERQQHKWFVFAAAIFGINTLVGSFNPPVDPFWRTIIDALTLAGLYIAIGVAILRYRLYDIDFLIRRTLAYALLTGLLAILYFGGVVALQEVFRAVTGQESPVAVVITTLFIAALFNPLRLRLQEVIDRRFYRRKYDAAQTIEAFGAAVRSEVNLEQLIQHLSYAVETAVQPDGVVLWLRSERKDHP